jgi:hypothetical protein
MPTSRGTPHANIEPNRIPFPEKLAMKIGGWKTDSVFRRYRITPRKDLHRAAAKMNEFFRREQATLEQAGTKEGTTASPSSALQSKRPLINLFS